MKSPLALGFVLATLLTLVSAEGRVNYDGYKVFRVETHDADVRGQLSELHTVDVGCGESDHIDIAVAPEDVEAFEELGLDTSVLSEDLAAALALEGDVEPFYDVEANFTLEARQQSLPALSWFNAYRPYAEHAQFFSQLQAAFPSNSRIFNAGSSYQGRTLYGIHMWGPNGQGSRPAIYFHGTVHAREWISAPVVEYVARQLIDGYRMNDPLVRSFFDKYDFYIIPFANPDGFVYSQNTDRLWRKNRQPRSGSSCVGTDGNRNWAFQWSTPGGASTNPCSETYRGAAAGDTPEIGALMSFTQGIRSRGIKLFIDWHSYGQYVLLPYGYNCQARATNHARQMTVAGNFVETIRGVSGTRFTYGPSCSTLYATTGSSPDYMGGVAGAEFSWTVELRPGSAGAGGFVLPAGQILPSGVEQWQGLRYVLNAV